MRKVIRPRAHMAYMKENNPKKVSATATQYLIVKPAVCTDQLG